MCSNPQFPADLVTFTTEMHNGKLHFFVQCVKWGMRTEQIHSEEKSMVIVKNEYFVTVCSKKTETH